MSDSLDFLTFFFNLTSTSIKVKMKDFQERQWQCCGGRVLASEAVVGGLIPRVGTFLLQLIFSVFAFYLSVLLIF